MCGLFFSIGLSFDSKRIDIVNHRGPDSDGLVEMDWSGRQVCLAHKRLSIIDLSESASQPARSADGRYHLLFNGAIYNFASLAESLKAEGDFEGPVNDTRVLLAGLIAHGTDFLSKLSGMFALVFVDNETRSVIAARDRFGIKPLYFTEDSNSLGFASEIKQLLDWGGSTRVANEAAIFDFLKFGVTDHSSATFFKGIFQLRPGHFAELDFSGDIPRVQQTCWYNLPSAILNISNEPSNERFWHENFRRAVNSHLVSDVPIGSCLSGGLDSSAIVASVAFDQEVDSSFKTFTAVYPGEEIDESEFADELNTAFNLDGNFTLPTASRLKTDIRELIWFQEEPFGSSSIFSQWCVFSSAKNSGVKVMLDGQGADEILHGYFSIFPVYLKGLIRQGKFVEAAVAIWRGKEALSPNPLKYSLKALSLLAPRFFSRIIDRIVAKNIDGDWLSDEFVNKNYNSPMSVLVRSQRDSKNNLEKNALNLVERVNLPMMLHWEDRNSMAHSIEARVPFLDHDLVEKTLSLPNETRLHYGTTKLILRRVMANILPEKILSRRKKIGFAAPEEVWLRSDLKNWAHLRAKITLDLFPDIFNRSEALAIVSKTITGERRFDPLVWRIICLGLWAEVFEVNKKP